MASLSEQIAELQEQLQAQIPEPQLNILLDATAELDASGIADNSLQVGAQLPAFELPNARGELVGSQSLLTEGPLVICFYRGGWCPYCNLELRALQQVLAEIRDHGAQLVAISPQTPDNSLSTAQRAELSFEVLSDLGNQYADQLGLVFKLPTSVAEIYRAFEFDLEHSNGDDSWALPMPATYVVDSSGKVAAAFANADYSQRMEPSDVLAALKKL